MAHKDEYLKNIALTADVLDVLPEGNKNKKFFSNYLESMARACKNEDKLDDTKWCFLEMISNAAMHQAIYAAYRISELPPELEKRWREETRNLDDINAEWTAMADAMSKEKDAIDAQIAAFQKRENDLGAFQSVATGRSKSFAEAEKKAQNYSDRAAAAQGQA